MPEKLKFKIKSSFIPTGDQPAAIDALAGGIERGFKEQVLLGVTGSGKTFTMANVIERVQKPTLVLAHNKTLAAQLCGELKEFFPENEVGYFVSYYDYYQPEAYIANTDTYIEKDSSVNDEIDKLRHSATSSLFERDDVIIVSSVSCIYSLGEPEEYKSLMLSLRRGQVIERDKVIVKLVDIQYDRNDIGFERNRFRVRGDVLEIFPSYSSDTAVRVEFFGDEIERISEINVVTGEVKRYLSHVAVYPASHYVVSKQKLDESIARIEKELEERIKYFKDNNKLIEAQRIEQRTRYDIEMLNEIGFCRGIENYSGVISGRTRGEAPYTLLDYFKKDFLLIVDESHVTIPQVRGMFGGDFSRKSSLIEFGFRLPSAFDNRPLNFEEFNAKLNQIIYVSATPAEYERQRSAQTVEQMIRPTGLIDPEISVRPTKGQTDDLLSEILNRAEKNERVLVTTLTKRMAEDLTEFFEEMGARVKYLHHDIDTIERMKLLRGLRLGEFDVLVGINLLREGLDLPEVSLVAILDADKQGFLRSETSLVQTIGRAARNVNGRVIMYADEVTQAMENAIRETNRRRSLQQAYNEEHGITPRSVVKDVRDVIDISSKEEVENNIELKRMDKRQRLELAAKLTKDMKNAAALLEFEHAAYLRDKIKELSEE